MLNSVDLDGQDPAQAVRWKPGVEAPPFLRSNSKVIELLEAILSNTEVQVPEVDITEAVAVQIYALVIDEKCF